MEYASIGANSVEVSRICLGTAFRSGLTDAGCRDVIAAAVEQGINFIDCANMYHGGAAETAVGKAIRGRREQFVITSKVGAAMTADGRREGLSAAVIMQAAEATLSRLRTDYLDFYLCHLPDDSTPIDETLGALNDLVRQGKIRCTGCSNFEEWRLREALTVAEQRRSAPFVCQQLRYNLLERQLEEDVIPFCERRQIGVTVYAPVARGLLAGRYRYGKRPPPDTFWHQHADAFNAAVTPHAGAIIDAVVEIARECDRTPAQVAIAWCLARRGVTAVISGADTPERVRENAGGAGWSLDAEAVARLHAVSA